MILFNRKPHELEKMKNTYKRIYDKDLESEFKKAFSGKLEYLYLSLLKGADSTSKSLILANVQLNVKEDCAALYKAGEGKWGCDEKVFIDILTNRPLEHLHAVFNMYQLEFSKTFEKVIKKEFSGDLEREMLNLRIYLY